MNQEGSEYSMDQTLDALLDTLTATLPPDFETMSALLAHSDLLPDAEGPRDAAPAPQATLYGRGNALNTSHDQQLYVCARRMGVTLCCVAARSSSPPTRRPSCWMRVRI